MSRRSNNIQKNNKRLQQYLDDYHCSEKALAHHQQAQQVGNKLWLNIFEALVTNADLVKDVRIQQVGFCSEQDRCVPQLIAFEHIEWLELEGNVTMIASHLRTIDERLLINTTDNAVRITGIS